jgi:phosphoglucosamine mutase
MSALFETDGVRGLANGLITAELSMQLAQAAAVVRGYRSVPEGVRAKVDVTVTLKLAGDYISAAMAAGIAGAGVDVFDAGVIPTPATAYLVADLAAVFGVVISASHNPAHDNGIKFRAFGEQKLSQGLRRRSKPNCCSSARVRSEPVWAGSGNLQTPRIDISPTACPLPHRLDGV